MSHLRLCLGPRRGFSGRCWSLRERDVSRRATALPCNWEILKIIALCVFLLLLSRVSLELLNLLEGEAHCLGITLGS